MPRFLVEGQWDDDSDTITSHVIDAANEDEAEQQVREVLEADPAYNWTFFAVYNLADEIRRMQELAAEPEGTYTQEYIATGNEMERCPRCKEFFSKDDLSPVCDDCLAADADEKDQAAEKDIEP